MAIDYWKLTQDFTAGDTVQRFVPGLGGLSLSPFTGRVTTVHKGLGVLDVQWPYGNERMFPDDVVKVDPRVRGYLPPTFDQTYSSFDTRKQAADGSSLWRTVELPAGFHVDLSKLFAKGASEVGAYDELWRKYVSSSDDAAIRDEVEKFYRVALNLSELRIQQHAAKTAAYWVAQNRQYRATAEELGSMKPACPKCGKPMRKTTYKMDKGARARLFACPKCLFLIKRDNLLGPDGQPVGWP